MSSNAREGRGDPQIGRALRLLRIHGGLTQGQVSLASGVGDDQISRYETAVADPPASKLGQVIRGCGSGWHDFADLIDPEEAAKRRGREDSLVDAAVSAQRGQASAMKRAAESKEFARRLAEAFQEVMKDFAS